MKPREIKEACHRYISDYLPESDLNVQINEWSEGEGFWVVNVINNKTNIYCSHVDLSQVDGYNKCVLYLEESEKERLIKQGQILDVLFEEYSQEGWLHIGSFPNYMTFEGIESIEEWYDEEILS